VYYITNTPRQRIRGFIVEFGRNFDSMGSKRALKEKPMSQTWRDDQPIWRQIKDRVLATILDGGIKEGEPLPSVRQVAVDLQVNPLTVSKAYQELADEGIVERRRGLGMFVLEGAQKGLSTSERAAFLRDEWPLVVTRIKRLGLSAKELLTDIEGDVA
jgi:GntR family transcriptional regulator